LAELLITTPQGRTRTHRLGTESVVLGRDPTCDIPLEDLSASRRHVIIRYENNGYVLEDLGSKNGTIINNAPTRGGRLRSGDEILIGAVRAVFRDDTDASGGMTVVVSEDMPRQDSTTYRGTPAEVRLGHRRLEILYRLTERLTRLRDRDELLSDAMDVCFDMLRFERGAIAIKQPRGNMVDWPVVRNLRGAEGDLKVSRTILSSALTHGERVIMNDSQGGEIDPTISIVTQGIRSAMCVPLQSEDQILGVIYGDRTSTGTTYTKEDIDFLAGIARLISTGLINSRLMDEQKLKIQLEGEITMAREIQTGLFPAELPDRPDIQVAALNDPGNHVSGDYYDTIELDDGRIAFLIADVTGEGVAASLLMANLQAAVRVTLPTRQPLGELFDQWNRLICENTDASRFITCLAWIVDPAKRTVEVCCAGHYPPFMVRTGGACTALTLDAEYPLGVVSEASYRSDSIALEPGPCTWVAFTDGVTEAANDKMELFGLERTESVLSEATTIDATNLIRKLRQAVRQHSGRRPQGDDITILAMHLP
jgi:sigma-B regulation protein RsbU (phosphoserine phosphatase)